MEDKVTLDDLDELQARGEKLLIELRGKTAAIIFECTDLLLKLKAPGTVSPERLRSMKANLHRRVTEGAMAFDEMIKAEEAGQVSLSGDRNAALKALLGDEVRLLERSTKELVEEDGQ